MSVTPEYESHDQPNYEKSGTYSVENTVYPVDFTLSDRNVFVMTAAMQACRPTGMTSWRKAILIGSDKLLMTLFSTVISTTSSRILLLSTVS